MEPRYAETAHVLFIDLVGFSQGTAERQAQHGGQPIDAAAPALAEPPGRAPRLRLQAVVQHGRSERARE